MTSVSKNVYINDLADIVNKYNNTYHSTINVKPVNEKSSVCIDFNVEINDEDPKFDHVPISKYNRIFAKDFTANLSEEIFIIKKVKNTGPWTYDIGDLNGEELLGSFTKKNCKS